jgi:DNA-binding transcriptional regulator YdaS (Cro superfamily)
MDELRDWLQEHSQGELAKALGITQGAISQWLASDRVPLERVRDIERVTGIPAGKLRPDVFVEQREHKRV